MENTAHTPGPWTVDTDTRDGAVTLVFDANAELVADTAPDELEDRAACRAECESNARLIAAAPDLLAACEALDPDFISVHPFIAAAIAKARGT